MKSRLLNEIEPKSVFEYFEDLAFIPRESGNEKQVSDWLMGFAAEHGLEAVQDQAMNVLIRKPASAGYEDRLGLIMQAHMDMVCEKKPGVDFNFASDPILFEIEEDKIISKNTTLGADDGIGAAYILALLEDADLKHPAIEAVFTADEERGLLGIEEFDFGQLCGQYLINLDSADEGVVIVGCAGGPMMKAELPVSWKNADDDKIYFSVHVNDLLGGHSGEDIHRGRANANKLLGGLLAELKEDLGADIGYFKGGKKANAIPRDAKAIIGIKESQLDDMDRTVGKYAIVVSEEYEVQDPDISVYCVPQPVPESVLTDGSADVLLGYINDFENGVIRMDEKHPAVVETSVSLGVVRTYEDKAEIWSMIRSSNEKQGEKLHDVIEKLTQKYGGILTDGAAFPAWQEDENSVLRRKYEEVYSGLYGKAPEVTVLHAGLEPGIFAQKMDRELDMISLGPDVRNLHAPGEYVTISSVERLWETLKELLEEL